MAQKTAITPRLNITRQVESRLIVTKTGLVRHISQLIDSQQQINGADGFIFAYNMNRFARHV